MVPHVSMTITSATLIPVEMAERALTTLTGSLATVASILTEQHVKAMSMSVTSRRTFAITELAATHMDFMAVRVTLATRVSTVTSTSTNAKLPVCTVAITASTPLAATTVVVRWGYRVTTVRMTSTNVRRTLVTSTVIAATSMAATTVRVFLDMTSAQTVLLRSVKTLQAIPKTTTLQLMTRLLR